ncbi:hypothetical protein [Pseudanabaena sp. PCC 6802]|uniref:hypothetical protein n=1 Tax=Pseudanabaena sp. PCC 6802 TaxID=118173 RepID=UPI00034AA48C|nr:hypothetical protein [Pseudanabaena sp. PCC 6802]
MRKFLILVSLTLSPTLLGAAAKRVQWTPNQLAATQKVCVLSALEANPKATNEQATYFCKCALDEASTKWTYTDFVKNEEKYAQQLGNEGVIGRCARATFQIVPESKPKVDSGIAQLNKSNNLNNLNNLMESLGKTWVNRPSEITNLGRRN